MFIEISKRLSKAPEERHMADAAPPELGELLCNVFYKHSAPLALQNQGIHLMCARRRAGNSPHLLQNNNHPPVSCSLGVVAVLVVGQRPVRAVAFDALLS